MNKEDIIELFRLGLKPIPLVWNIESKTATSHVIAHSEITEDNWKEEDFIKKFNGNSSINGIALKLFSPFGCVDFDLKNTDDKEVFNKWMQSINAQDDEIMSKVCIEETRNKGYHVYIKYSKLKNKVSLAKEEEGEEVIAVYTGGTLSYCDPTPGYNMFHNELQDLEELTDDQYDIIVSSAESLNKYTPKEHYGTDFNSGKVNGRILVNYPTEYENLCLQFDQNVTDEVFESILNDMTLFENNDYVYHKKKDFFTAYLRQGSKASLSAKVYHKSRRVLLFSGSIEGYPYFGDRSSNTDHNWVLSPSKMIFHKNNGDWAATTEEIRLICDSADIYIIEQKPITEQELITPDRLKFPMDIFPESIRNFIVAQRMQHEYIAAFVLGALSTMVGNRTRLIASDGYNVKPIIYLAIVAPPGASKSPALKLAFKPLEKLDSLDYKKYKKEMVEYKKEMGAYKHQKKGDNIEEPEHPVLKQILIKDSTIEMLLKILSLNDMGCCLLADELSGFLGRMNRYTSGDEVQKWLELWSGSSILMQRIGREEDKVEDPFCSIIGGIQPGVLETLSSDENQHNGFFHRFLFCYPETDDKMSWKNNKIEDHIIEGYDKIMQELNFRRLMEIDLIMTDDANTLYGDWFNNKNKKYNAASNDNIKGIIAKYQDYCLRFSIIIQSAFNAENSVYGNIVDHISMEKAIRLTEYFFGNMNKSLKILSPETPKDKLTGSNKKLYDLLPQSFSHKSASDIAVKLNIKPAYCRVILSRWVDQKEPILTKTGTQRDVSFEKIY